MFKLINNLFINSKQLKNIYKSLKKKNIFNSIFYIFIVKNMHDDGNNTINIEMENNIQVIYENTPVVLEGFII